MSNGKEDKGPTQDSPLLKGLKKAKQEAEKTPTSEDSPLLKGLKKAKQEAEKTLTGENSPLLKGLKKAKQEATKTLTDGASAVEKMTPDLSQKRKQGGGEFFRTLKLRNIFSSSSRTKASQSSPDRQFKK